MSNSSLGDFSGIPFSKDNNDFNGNQARELAILIGSAYAQFEQQGEHKWSIPKGYDLIKELMYDRKRKVFGFVAKKDGQAFIIIRGTRTAYEWYNNTAIKYDKYISVKDKKWGVTTKGFYSIYIDLRDEIKEVLQTLSESNHIFVAGHSLGGALATLTIPDLIDSDIPVDKITAYTFASPRCGDRELAYQLNNSGVKHWRIANTEDIVPTLPGATANIISPERPVSPEEMEENFIVKTYNDLKSKGMKTFEHAGTPIYFTIGTNSIQDNHNLEIVYMTGIGQLPATLPEA
jgi:hypothetical protein